MDSRYLGSRTDKTRGPFFSFRSICSELVLVHAHMSVHVLIVLSKGSQWLSDKPCFDLLVVVF